MSCHLRKNEMSEFSTYVFCIEIIEIVNVSINKSNKNVRIGLPMVGDLLNIYVCFHCGSN